MSCLDVEIELRRLRRAIERQKGAEIDILEGQKVVREREYYEHDRN
jgi:hypothetical protein